MARDIAQTGLDPTDRTAIALLGLPTTDYSSWFDITKEIRTGLPYASIEHLASEMNLEVTKHLFPLVGYSERTAHRVQKEKTKLKAQGADRLFRLARIFAVALEVFEEKDRALRWLTKPNRALGGQIPMELLDTNPGALQVEQTLRRIEHGIFA